MRARHEGPARRHDRRGDGTRDEVAAREHVMRYFALRSSHAPTSPLCVVRPDGSDLQSTLQKQPWVVGDHTGDTEALEPPDLGGVVDGPDVELAALLAHRLDQRRGDEA